YCALRAEPTCRGRWPSAARSWAPAAAVDVLWAHMLWGVERGWPTIEYAVARTQGERGWHARFVYASAFVWMQGAHVLMMVIALAPLLRLRRETVADVSGGDWRSRRRLLSIMLLGPVLLHLLI